MAAERPSPLLTVYSRNYCHLCDDLISGLRALQARSHFEIAIIDVACDVALEARYGNDVPVLVHGDRELCRHRLNESLVTDYLVEIG
ncbi:MAG: glutaredoxin [Betaproteobacteria bacterium]|jgi:hypothetical protein|nr:glutaredoxin [Betaproteobacteria bacterium]MEA3155851.1 hypothetical protein [Betaproteobacteria bacterium]